jgi:hypothetical protein
MEYFFSILRRDLKNAQRMKEVLSKKGIESQKL